MRTFLAVLFLSLARPISAERLVCRAAADTWVAMHRWETAGGGAADALKNHGAEPQLLVRGRESFALLAFDLSPAAGMTIEKAVLRIHRQAAPVPLHTAGLSTISGSGPWSEESANYFHPRGSGESWSYPGSDLVDVTFAQGGSLYAYERARDAGEGWWEIDVPTALVHSLLNGDQYGLMLTDEKGQTQTRHVFSSRESAHPPVLILEGSREDRTPPGRVRALQPDRTPRRAGSIVLHFGGAGDDRGSGIAAHYELRYSARPIAESDFESAAAAPRWSLDPLSPKPHPLVNRNSVRDDVTAVVEGLTPGEQYHFAARAIDEAGNRGPVSPLGALRAYKRTDLALPPAPAASRAGTQASAPAAGLRVWAVPELLKIDPRTGALLEQSDFADHRAHNSVWDASAAGIRLAGAQNEFVAAQLAIESERPVAAVQVTVSRPLFPGAKLPPIFENTGAVQLYREWFVPDDRDTSAARPWYPDALVPLEGPFDLPAADNQVPGQTVQPVFVDVYVPRGARPGTHTGELLVRAAGAETTMKIVVDVLPFSLPDKLGFLVDLNCYSGVERGYQVRRGTPEYRKLEHAYHRLAHLHRANLDVLGYSHNGSTVADHAPPLAGEGAATRVSDWSDWDAHFGPLLDGTAFADLPRASVPVPMMYLPFFENWPGDLRRSYRFNDYLIAKTEEEYREILTSHALRASAIEEAFTPEYEARFSAVVADFARHLKERGWTGTDLTIYFNDKYYYKRPEQGGRGVSWWLLDEPNHRDDVRALSYFFTLARKGLEKYPDVPIRLRTDISRVEWIRDLLAGQIDINCVSRRFFDKNRYLMDGRYRFGRKFINYASTNHPRETNVSVRAWCWRVWLNGGDGVLPWNAVRGAESWERAEPLTVFYPGSKFGRNEPYASLRLIAYRRGQQDIEYLLLLARKRGWDRDAVAHAAGQALELSGEVRQAAEEDAGAISFKKVKDADLDTLRLRVARAITDARP